MPPVASIENLIITGQSLQICERIEKKVILVSSSNNNCRKSAKRYFHPQKSRDNQQEIIQKTIANNYIKWMWRNKTKKKWNHFRQLQNDRRQQLIKYGLKHQRINFFSFIAKTVTHRGRNLMKKIKNKNREILKIPSFIYPRFNDNYPWRGRQTLCKKLAIKAATAAAAATTTSTLTTGCYTKNNCSAVLHRIQTANTPEDFTKLLFFNKNKRKCYFLNKHNNYNREQQVKTAVCNTTNKPISIQGTENIENYIQLAIKCYNEGFQKHINYLNNLQKVNTKIYEIYQNKNNCNLANEVNGLNGVTRIGITNQSNNNNNNNTNNNKNKLSVMNNSDINKLTKNFLTKLNITKLPEIILTDYSVPTGNKGAEENVDDENNDQLHLDDCSKKGSSFNEIKDDNQHANNNDNLTNVNNNNNNAKVSNDNQPPEPELENSEQVNIVKKITLVNAATSVCHINNFKHRCLTIPKEKHFCSESRPP